MCALFTLLSACLWNILKTIVKCQRVKVGKTCNTPPESVEVEHLPVELGRSTSLPDLYQCEVRHQESANMIQLLY